MRFTDICIHMEVPPPPWNILLHYIVIDNICENLIIKTKT